MTKKLIEVSLPLDTINDQSAYDKMPGIGAHPKGVHYYPARLPLPSARSILFASLVDDPSAHPDKFPNEKIQEKERERLFQIVRDLCQPKIHTKTKTFETAIAEIKKHCDNNLPVVHDPFSGGGAIPLEGMRLGMDVIAADLNPVSVILNKATVELLPRFAKHPPINPGSQNTAKSMEWENAAGLVEDLKYYGEIIQKRAEKKLGKYFPKAKLPGGKEATVLTYIWARTVKCKNPTCGCQMPLVRTFALASKKTPKVYFKPVVKQLANGGNEIVSYDITNINPGTGTYNGRSNRASCVACNEVVTLDYIKSEGQNGRLNSKLVALVVDLGRGKGYVSPTNEQEGIALSTPVDWEPDFMIADHPQYSAPPRFGLTHFKDLFTNRQLLSLTCLSKLINDLHGELKASADQEYLNLLILYLFFSIDRLADFNCNLTTWKHSGEQQMHLFTANRFAMAVDYTEANVLCGKAISWKSAVGLTAGAVEVTLNKFCSKGKAIQKNAEVSDPSLKKIIVSTDPPYYNNIPYADLMDFFYVWIKKNLQPYFPEITRTMLTPKEEELVANEHRFNGNKEAAKEHFEGGFKRAFTVLKNAMDDRFPMTIYYAFKQEEEEEDGNENSVSENEVTLTTGWETILEAVVQSGFQITATWPIRASQKWRLRAMGSNALASYIVMVCRKRAENAPSITRRQYLQELNKELPEALTVLQRTNLAPVDLAQAALGPGMGIYSRYSSILEQDGSRMKVRTALSLINKTLDEILTEQEGDFDAESRWALAWFEQYGTSQQDYGPAETLSRAKGTAVNALVQAGIISAGAGKVKLLSREELSDKWDPLVDNRVVIWEMTQQLIKQLRQNGEKGAARLYKKIGGRADVAKELAYRLFLICEKKGLADEAQAYNALVLSWNRIISESYNIKDSKPEQGTLGI